MRFQLIALCLLAVPQLGLADEQDDWFRDKIAPILQRRCTACHNDHDRQGDFSIVSRQEVFESQLVEPGDADASYLVELITSSKGRKPEMPKSGSPLTTAEVRMVRNWIRDGANWPDDFVIEPLDSRNFEWWSFKPVQRTQPPVNRNDSPSGAAEHPIDAFVLARLRDNQLDFSPPADRRTLIRRLSYDLTGLPPTYQETEEFVRDRSPRAYERVVDRLLASPRYGEHWARHWLDVVKYADTCGYDKDKLRPHAWPYRDYVIRSFNQDKPYRRFVREQIAGDVFYPGEPDGILGLGFIAAGPWDFIGHVEVPEEKIDGMVARNLDRDEMVTNTFNTFCSLTVQCARCHDHKFDPFTQEQYYGLQAVFAAVDRANRVYGEEPGVRQRKQQLNQQQFAAQSVIADLEQQIAEGAGDELAKIDERIAELQKTANKRPEFGFHSQLSPRADDIKWVEVDLGEATELSRIILRPCHDDFAGIGAGFGFPVRFAVEVDGKTIYDQSKHDFANPMLAPVEVPAALKGRRVRVVANQLFDRRGSFIFALAELQVLDNQGRNLALKKQVRSVDSIEMPVRWAEQNLVDGIWFAPEEVALRQDRLAELRTRRKQLVQQVIGSEGVRRMDEARRGLENAKAAIAKLPPGKMVYAAATEFRPEGNFKPTRGKPRPVRVLTRGDVQTPGDVAQPGRLPLAEQDDWKFSVSGDSTEADHRARLAEWLTSDGNPLLWRSIVNRVWHYHFGAGIISTPNDFGRMGAEPSHPELLDWLAGEFRESGGSLKKLHRLIVTSSTYRQSSQSRPQGESRDASNRLLWRMNRRRLSAEEIRDSILLASGKLDFEMGGPGFYLFVLEKTEHSPHYEYHKFDHSAEDSYRRSIYRFVVRSQPDPFMTTLDCADSSQSTPVRNETQTSLQALTMLNNRFNLVMATHFEQRIRAVADSPQAQVDLALQALVGRRPTATEARLLAEYVNRFSLRDLARMLFNLSEFIYID